MKVGLALLLGGLILGLSPVQASGPMPSSAATGQRVESSDIWQVARHRRCRPQTIDCKAGTQYVCYRCVPDSKCVPQKIQCRKGKHYVCNTCVPD